MAEPDTLAGRATGTEKAALDVIKDIDAEMESATKTFTFQAMKRSDFTALEDAYPYDEETPTSEYLTALLSETLVDPVMSVEQTAQLLDLLSDGQASVLEDAAWRVNRETGALDF
jgi:hypothetical protein